MSAQTFQQYWNDRIRKNLASYRQVLEKDVHHPRNINYGVGFNCLAGLELVYGGELELAKQFFERTVEFALWLLAPDRATEDKPSSPAGQADIHFGLGVAEGFLAGRAEPERFLNASRDLETEIAGVERFDYMDLQYCLSSIRYALLARDWERARTLLKSRWSRVRRHEEGNISKRLAARDATVLPQLDDYFERSRLPEKTRQPPTLVIPNVDWSRHPIQLAVLRAELVHPDAPVDWWQAARDVAR